MAVGNRQWRERSTPNVQLSRTFGGEFLVMRGGYAFNAASAGMTNRRRRAGTRALQREVKPD